MGKNLNIVALVCFCTGIMACSCSWRPLDNWLDPGHAVPASGSGNLDASFLSSGTGANANLWAVAIHGDRKILIAGDFGLYNGTMRMHIARLNADGSLDSSFLATGNGLDNTIESVAIQVDGKIIIGGDFLNYNGTARKYIARLNYDGSLDTSFVPAGTGLQSAVTSVAIQGDGKIIVGGDFTDYNGTPQWRIARLNSDGSLDTSFSPPNPNHGAYSTVWAVAIQGDGKILIGGQFTNYCGEEVGHIAKVNSDGTLDTSFFSTGTGSGRGTNATVWAIAIQGDGKIIIGGDFTSYKDNTNTFTRGYIARLNRDGSLDTSFLSTGTGADNTVTSIVIQADGKILIGGQFANYNGTARAYIARLYSDGSLDSTFLSTGTELDNTVRSIAIQGDGKIIIGGAFTTFNSVGRGHVARLD